MKILCAALGLAVMSLGGCDTSEPEGIATEPTETEYMTVGTLNSVDAAAGTVNISHSPVPAAGWPAMTMDFKLAEPSEAADLKPGQRVDLHFKIEGGMNATITHLAAID